ncbi:hypothetical protein [Mailhella massiliensis]|uniref:Uncharacterized protein n=1 Tax=Mailhella massiliensis TaxID=1903261 RepID=A0A921DQA1_9BACT|nr:hypothetical protein [Mailhella massiliensis]HJD96260.1 hypothetical protein [Mailhella massiliensis]
MQEGEGLTLSAGEHLRLGGRLSRIVNEHLRPCIGAAWEHEFDGRAHAAASGFAIDSPNLKAIPA